MGNTVDSVTITVNDCTLPELFFVPTLLHSKDLFVISGLPENSVLEVFDVRGRIVYKNENYDNSLSGATLAAGSYVYRLSFATGETQTGKIVVIR